MRRSSMVTSPCQHRIERDRVERLAALAPHRLGLRFGQRIVGDGRWLMICLP